MMDWLGKIFIGLFLKLQFGLLYSQQVLDTPIELKGIDVEEKLGYQIPLQLTFIDENGKAVQLQEYFRDGKPVLLTLGYYKCPMLCNLVQNGVCGSAKQVDLRLGVDYKIVTVSIDPSETPELALAKKNGYKEAFGRSGVEEGWHFLIGRAEMSRSLAESVGFNYYYDSKRNEYAHPAVAFLISPNGKITRYLYGINYRQFDLKLALIEASEGKIGTTIDRIILSCFHYDPKQNSYVPFAINIMKLGGFLTIVMMGAILGTFWIKESRKHEKKGKPPIDLTLN